MSTLVYSANRFEGFSTESGLAGQLVRDIAQDRQGFIWFATAYGLSRYDGYSFKNFYHEKDNKNTLSGNNLWQLHIDYRGVMWVVSNNGLDEYVDGRFVRHSVENSAINSITSSATGLWMGTDIGVVFYSYDRKLEKTHLNGLRTQSLLRLSSQGIIAATTDGLYRKRPNQSSFEKWHFISGASPKNIDYLHVDSNNMLWAATRDALFKIDPENNSYQKIYPQISQYVIQSIVSNAKHMWIGTLRNGLYKIGADGSFENFKYEAQLSESLSDNVIASLLLDRNSTLWIGTFGGGVNYRNVATELFGLQQPKSSHLSCLKSRSVNYLYQVAPKDYIIGTASGAYRVNQGSNICRSIKLDSAREKDSKPPAVYSAFYQNKEKLYLGYSQGLARYNEKTETSERLFPNEISSSVYFIRPVKNNLLLGTYFNVYLYDLQKETLLTYKTPESDNSQPIGANNVGILDNGEVFFASSIGVLVTESSDRLVRFLPKGHKALNSPIDAFLIDENSIWIGNANDHRLFQFDLSGQLIDQFPLSEAISSIRPVSLVADKNSIWIGTTQGLFKLDKESGVLKKFTRKDGLQSNIFNRNSTHQTLDGKLLFGGKQGFNTFYPEKIYQNSTPPKVVLTELRRFNKLIEPTTSEESGAELQIKGPIEGLEELRLSHRDYVISLQFAGLHFSDPRRNQYAYKLEGLHQDWIETDYLNRVASFTNLGAGDYVFRVKASNKDGIWSSLGDQVALNIHVSPAPWLSWWAFSFYGMSALIALLLFIRLRTQSAIKRADSLEIEVRERTKEIQHKKTIIESLLEQKNEQFANISHEFRTPLTLILGPLEKELQALDAPKDPKKLQMIQRNAVRLLGMVEQILKLTELKQEQQVRKVPHALNVVARAIFESFRPLAEERNILLNLALAVDCNILAAKDALEIILGNLISNAIKYTPTGGKVSISSNLTEDQVLVTVKDNGVGMNESEQVEIFERFVRLGATSDKVGTGIGLSIVSELVRAHDGRIQIKSQKGKGSSFILTLPTTKLVPEKTVPAALQSISHLTQVEATNKPTIQEFPANVVASDAKDKLLLIEDNSDMQQYIQSVLSEKYSCLSASRGQRGIEIAIEQVPDLIICDVMMPGINGYEVARRLRKDERTSHIPIVLLTAKGDKKSRIQGWDENIDDYMTKPFDEGELLIRISNILSIRNILRLKASQEFARDSETRIDVCTTDDGNAMQQRIGLNEKEQAFVDKLMEVIKAHHSDPNFQRVHMASKMAVSERQLHRKVNALLNQHPIEMLRDYRLKMAMTMLKNGEQVGLVADRCGFSSPSYFSQCFKARFGKTPKDIIQAPSH